MMKKLFVLSTVLTTMFCIGKALPSVPTMISEPIIYLGDDDESTDLSNGPIDVSLYDDEELPNPTGITAGEDTYDATIPESYTFNTEYEDIIEGSPERVVVTVNQADPPVVVNEPQICAGDAVGGAGGAASPFCDSSVFHFAGMNPISEAIITVENTGPNSMQIVLSSPDPADPIDDVVIPGGSGAVVSQAVTAPNEYTVTLTWGGAPPANVNLNILWSFQSFGGFWQLNANNFDIPFEAACSPNTLLEVMCPMALTLEPTENWFGFMNVFELPENGGGFVFPSGWAPADLVALYNGDELCLQPNQIGDPDSFWYQGGGGPGASGNKTMEANFYNEDQTGAFVNQTVSFSIEVTSNDFSCGHASSLYIREFNPSFAGILAETFVPIAGPGVYNVMMPISATGGPVQYGIQTVGPNVWVTDAPACGSIKAMPLISTVQWYDAAIGGNLQGMGTQLDPTGTTAEEGPFDNTVPGTYTYYAQCTDATGCISERVAVTITVNQADPPVVVNEPQICAGDAVGGAGGAASPFCDSSVFHFAGMNPISEAIITVENTGPNSMQIVLSSPDPADPIDDVVIPGGSGAVVSQAVTAPNEYTVTLTWGGAPPANVNLNILWSFQSFGGFWQLNANNFDIPFEAACSPNTLLEVMCPMALTLEPTENWFGFMNVFELPENGGGFVFPSGWAPADLVALYNGDELCLQPNQIGDPDSFWYQGGGGPGAPGNKTMEANFYNEDQTGAFVNQTVSFSIEVTSNDFSCGHASSLYIREFNPSFAGILAETFVPIAGPGVYNVMMPISATGGPVQYGIQTVGPNVWVTDAPACGSIKAMPLISTVQWYDAAIGGNLQGMGTQLDPTGTTAEEGPFDNTVPGTYTYYAQCTDATGCISERVAVTITVNQADPPVVVNEPQICAGDAVGGAGGAASPFCDSSVFHFAGMNPISEAIITVENTGPNSMQIVLSSPDPADPIDDVVIPGGSGAVVSQAVTAPNEYTVTLTWGGAPPANVNLNILWSFQSFGGFWQLNANNFDIPFEAACSPNTLLEVMCPMALTLEPTENWFGFMNVFELPENGGGFVFPSGWAPADLVALYNGDELCLQPNQIGDPDSFWYQGGGGPGAPGNKTMEANFYNEDQTGAFVNQTVSFSIEVTSNDFSCGHASSLYIREFNPSFAGILAETFVPIAGPGVYNVMMPISTTGGPVQYGIQTVGPNVWVTDAPACGSIKAMPLISTVQWYDAAMGGDLQGMGTQLDPTGTTAEEGPFDNTVPGTYTYYAQCTDATGCISERVAVTITVNQADPPVVVNEPQICAGDAVGGAGGTASPFCDSSVFHFADMNPISEAIITVENTGPNSMQIVLSSPDPADPIDDVVIPGGSGAVVSQAVTAPNEYTVTLTWGGAPPANVNLNILWSFQSFGGFWQLNANNFDIPFEAACSPNTLLEVMCPMALTLEPTENWFGFMNVFELPENGGGFVFPSGWAPADLVALYNGDELCLQPNQIGDSDSFWYQGGGGPGAPGNKTMEANFYNERPNRRLCKSNGFIFNRSNIK